MKNKAFVGLVLCSAALFFQTAKIAGAQSGSVVFNRSTVVQFIEDIDKPRNADKLKVHYFGHRRTAQGGLPIEEGWLLLKQASEEEKPGTLRWFLLQSVKGAVAYRLPSPQPEEAVTAYRALFDNAEKAPQAKAEYIVRSSINEFMLSLDGPIDDLGEKYSYTTLETVTKAWKAYLISLRYQDKFSHQIPRLDWVTLLEHATVPHDFEALVTSQLQENKTPSYDLLSVASYISRSQDLPRAIALLESAKPLLPKLSNGEPDLEEARRYYARLINLYQQNAQVDLVVKATQEQDALIKP